MSDGRISTESLDELLAAYGIHVGEPSERRGLAADLASKGFREEWLDLLWEEARTGRNPKALLAGYLTRPWPKLWDLVQDLSTYRNASEKRGERKRPDTPPSHYGKGVEETFRQQARANNQTLDEYMAERDERHAFALVAHERRQVPEAAREMGWSEERICEAIRRWAPGSELDPEWLIHRTTRDAISPEQAKAIKAAATAQVAAERREKESRRDVAALDFRLAPATVDALRKKDEQAIARMDRAWLAKHGEMLRAAGLTDEHGRLAARRPNTQ